MPSRKNQAKIVYLIAFQFTDTTGGGYGTSQMSFDQPIRARDLPGIQENIRKHFGKPDAIVTSFSRFAD